MTSMLFTFSTIIPENPIEWVTLSDSEDEGEDVQDNESYDTEVEDLKAAVDQQKDFIEYAYKTIDNQNAQIDKLLDDDDCLQEFKNYNDKLIKYFDHDYLRTLIYYITVMPDKDDGHNRGRKYPFITVEIFNCEINQILDKFFEAPLKIKEAEKSQVEDEDAEADDKDSDDKKSEKSDKEGDQDEAAKEPTPG
jgi:hypothetical protein